MTPPPLPGGITIEEFKLVADRQLTAGDDLLDLCLRAAVAKTEQTPPEGTGRNLLATDGVDLTFATAGRRRVRVPDFRAIVAVSDGINEIVGYETVSQNGLVVQIITPWPVFGTLHVAGDIGFDEVPYDLRLAIYELAVRILFRRESGFADGAVAGEGMAAGIYFRDLPRNVASTFTSFTVQADSYGLV